MSGQARERYEMAQHEMVTLVDRTGKPIGQLDKLAAHENGGKLHLAFSIFIFNDDHQLLLQKRAAGKYHFSNLWSNSCCGHPRPDEAIRTAAERRLREEFGFSTALQHHHTLIYQATDSASGLTEKELLHVFTGRYQGRPEPEAEEISDWRWQSLLELRQQLRTHPEAFTPWFRLLVKEADDSAFL